MNSVNDLLSQRIAWGGNKLAYIFERSPEDSDPLSYAALGTEVARLGNLLRERGMHGKTVLLLYPSGLEYIVAFYACLYAGAIAVPVFPPRKNQKLNRLTSILDNAAPALLMATRQVFDDTARGFSDIGIPDDHWLLTDLGQVSADDTRWNPALLSPNHLAFLQYTSGSTGDPKGVMVSHGNLLVNEQMIADTFRTSTDSVVVSWLPIYHDMGLIGNVIQSLWMGGQMAFTSPFQFLQKPYSWLEMISRYKASHAGGPNFAFDLCTRRITDEQIAGLDLSHWRVAFNGSEPVLAETLNKFCQRFATCGFRAEAMQPCYGMAEATLLVTGSKEDKPFTQIHADKKALQSDTLVVCEQEGPGTQPLVSSGGQVADSTIAIADPESGHFLPEGQVGEIWVKGPHIAHGYYRKEEETAASFHVAAAHDQQDSGYLRTGDLGLLHQGELFVTGRLKDLIILRGRNLYPQDIELTIADCHPDVQPGSGAAFSVPGKEGEELVIVQEVKRTAIRSLDPAPVFESIRQAVAKNHEAQVAQIVLIMPASLLKTSSGKIQRRGNRQAYLDDQLRSLHRWPETEPQEKEQTEAAALSLSPDALSQWLMHAIASRSGISADKISPDMPFDQMGLDSLAAVELSGELSEKVGREVPATSLYDYPNPASLLAWLQGEKTTGTRAPSASTAEHKAAIAVEGMALRLPGADSPEAFWELIRSGKTAITEVADFRKEAFEDAQYPHISKAGFISDIDLFAAETFGISRKEAERMDPQQRLLLELSWHAMQDAGYEPEALKGRRVGVFVGISSQDYSRLSDSEGPSLYQGTGNAASIAANRLSYFFDFSGPSMAIDTACSSSLVATHLACKSLQQDECDLALVAGVNLLLDPALSRSFAAAGMLSADAYCHTFDNRASGYVRGEGAAVLLLQKAGSSEAAGKRSYGHIAGSAINQDGRSNGLTAPNGPAQERVIREALRNAGISPEQVILSEAHGTGTSLGDPIEVNTLQSIYGQHRQGSTWLSALKSNIGHLEAAAGIAGLIKALLCLYHRERSPQAGFATLNELIKLPGSLQISTENAPLPASDTLYAGVSSFGFGGANAHVLLSTAPATAIKTASDRLPLKAFARKRYWLSSQKETAPGTADIYALQWETISPLPSHDGQEKLLPLALSEGLRKPDWCTGEVPVLSTQDTDVLASAGDQPLLLFCPEPAAIDQTHCQSFLWLLQQLGTQPRRILLSYAGASGAPLSQALTGMSHSAAIELPQLHICHYYGPQDEASLRTALAQTGKERLLWQEGKQWQAARLGQQAQQGSTQATDYSGLHLVTGATGGAGRALCTHLAEQGATQIIALARKAPADWEQQVAAFAEKGCQLTLLPTDLATATDLKEAEAAIATADAPFGGIWHLAGTLADTAITEMDSAQLSTAFAAKVNGAALLDALSRSQQARHFVLFSSVAAVMGSPGQANYAAANASLDHLAAQRRAQGLPALSINWGLWAGEGMSESASDSLREGRSLIKPLPAGAYLRALDTLIDTAQPQVMVASLEEKALHLLPSTGYFAGIVPQANAESSSRGDWARALAGMETAAAERALLDRLSTAVSKTLGATGDERPAADLGFAEMGMDSLMLVELQQQLNHHLDLQVAITSLYSFPDLRSLSRHLLTLLPLGESPETAASEEEQALEALLNEIGF